MLFFKYLLESLGAGMLTIATIIPLTHLFQIFEYRRKPVAENESKPQVPTCNWGLVQKLAIWSWVPLVFGLSIIVVPSGMGGVKVSQVSGTRPGTLYPGVHLVKPLLEKVVLYDIRDQVLSTDSSKAVSGATDGKPSTQGSVFTVQAREGLIVGLAITVRYRLDAKKLDYIHANLPQPVEQEIVPPVVASVFREVIPNYTVRELFATRREEIRQKAAEQITAKLGADGVIVKEVMLRDIQLPTEYAKGLEGLLLKEQQNEGLNFETEIKTKQVRIAELEADAERVRAEKQALGQANVRVLQAKGEADAMQYTLPLKEKQIQQSKLEAEARMESTVKNAEAQARAKVIDSKAELERRNLLTEAEAQRIRVVASADNERMVKEANILRGNPLLINKIVAERMSDKLQMVMVPSNGKFFFNDVLKSGLPPTVTNGSESEDSGDDGDDDAKPATQPSKHIGGQQKGGGSSGQFGSQKR
jgi:regulator of protease activity HflC (stomatin/prohibitin superfamily)